MFVVDSQSSPAAGGGLYGECSCIDALGGEHAKVAGVGADGAAFTDVGIGAGILGGGAQVWAEQPAQLNAGHLNVLPSGERVVRVQDGKPGLAARTIARRLSTTRGLFSHVAAWVDAGVSRNRL
ncbi:hypothetical protein ACX9NE_17220 [Mycobacterium sp. ML4]